MMVKPALCPENRHHYTSGTPELEATAVAAATLRP